MAALERVREMPFDPMPGWWKEYVDAGGVPRREAVSAEDFYLSPGEEAAPLDAAALERVAAQMAAMPDGGRREMTGRAMVMLARQRCECATCRRRRDEWFLRR